MDIIIAIPTHRRPELCFKSTLSMIVSQWIKFSDAGLSLQVNIQEIALFISDSEDMQAYEKNVREWNDLKVVFGPDGLPDLTCVLCKTTTATEKFNYIHNYKNAGEKIVVIEDDCTDIITGENQRNLFDIIHTGFICCSLTKLELWGVYPSSNTYFMKPGDITYGYVYIVANMFGFIATADPKLMCSLGSKTDYERSIKYYIYRGGAVRLNDVAMKTRNYVNAGGMQLMGDDARADAEYISSHKLSELYGSLIKINRGRVGKSKFAEVKLINHGRYQHLSTGKRGKQPDKTVSGDQ